MDTYKLAMCFPSRGLTGFNCGNSFSRQLNVRSVLPSHRLFPASCKMRYRHLSYRKQRQVKKAAPKQLPNPAGFPSSGNDDTDDEKVRPELVLEDNHDMTEHIQNIDLKSDPESSLDVEHIDDDLGLDKLSLTEEMKSLAIDVSGGEKHSTSSGLDEEENSTSSGLDEEENSTSSGLDEEENSTSSALDEEKNLTINKDGGEQLPILQMADLLGMIRNAERNIRLLNQARIHALEDHVKIFNEKEALQSEINVLEMRLAENDAKMKIAAQEKMRMKLLEDHLEKLRNELAQRNGSDGSVFDVDETDTKILNEEVHLLQNSSAHFLNEELSSLRTENMSLKNDLEALKAELDIVKSTGERIIMLERERLLLESSLKDLESKYSASQEDVSNLSSLKAECKGLWEKVETLQTLLDKTTKQADQAILVLQQNQELRKKVDKLEESLEEANVYKLSSEKFHQYNELMQQKIKLMEERLRKSDEEIQSYVQLYQESVQEFQDTLSILKEESKKRSLDEPVDEMPREFWSRLLLIIDGWLLEKKISTNDAKLLREMLWKRDSRIRDVYMECIDRTEPEAVSRFLKLISSHESSRLHVIHVAAEMAPVAKVGGLGDVVTGLGKALQKRGHLVEVILPKYDCMQYDHIHDLRVLDVEVESYFDGKLHKNKIWVGTVEGLPVYFIEPHHCDKFFWRGQFYGEYDDFKRFSFFSRAALELLHQSGKRPDIIHCHDWQTAFIAPLYWDLYAPKGLNSARICFTCHNFEYQGTAPASELSSCGLDVYHLNRPDRMQDNSSHDRINAVKGAVVFSNIVTTVSPTYAQEVRTAAGGKGLHSTLSLHSKKFTGILNGIDTESWNPASDKFLEVQYSSNDIQGKAENKLAIRRHLGLSTADSKRPMVGCITRLVPQKGVHLIRYAIYRTLELGGQFVLLGSSPVTHIQSEFEDIAGQFQNHDHARLILKYDESLSHSIYAASDMFIIPSIFEPCGLTQMIAMRYGSIPIARKTGGLNDSVFDIDDDTVPLQFRNAFTFLTPDEQGLSSALERAFNYYRNNPEGWKKLVQKDMDIDFSWETSASQYEELYLKSVARARTAARRA